MRCEVRLLLFLLVDKLVAFLPGGLRFRRLLTSGQDEEVDTPYEASRASGPGRRRDASNSALNCAPHLLAVFLFSISVTRGMGAVLCFSYPDVILLHLVTRCSVESQLCACACVRRLLLTVPSCAQC